MSQIPQGSAANPHSDALTGSAPPARPSQEMLMPMMMAVPRAAAAEISLRTDRFRPSHMVTLRNSVDGFSRDVFGLYVDGTWRFSIPAQAGGQPVEYKFLLDGHIWSAGMNLSTAQSLNRAASDVGGDISFEGEPAPRFLHDYGRLRVDNTRASEQAFPGNRDESVHYPVIVIGGGMMGGIMANELTNAGIDTLVLEVGTAQFTTHVDNLFLGVPFDQHQVRDADVWGTNQFWAGTNMLLGGRSVFWSGVIPRIMDFEYDLPYWPEGVAASLKDVAEGGQGYFAKAEALLNKLVTHGDYAQALVGHFRGRIAGMQVDELPWSFHQPDQRPDMQGSHMVYSNGMFSSVNLLNDRSGGGADPGARHLTVNTGHMAVELETQGDRVVAVRCQDLLGNRVRRYTADYFVLALGSVQSPNLVLNSRLNDRSGKVGVGLTDHPEMATPQFEVPVGNPFHNTRRMAKLHFQPTAARQAARIGNARDKFPMYAEVNITGASRHVSGNGSVSFGNLWRLRFADEAVWEGIARNLTTCAVSMKMRSYAPLNDANRIHARGIGKRPGVEYHGYNSDFMTPGYVNFLMEHAWLFKNEILTALDPSYDTRLGVEERNTGTIQHSSGSLRMGAEGQGVVDPNLRFHEYENLFASDASVLPYCLTCNPSLVVAALTLRLADHLRGLVNRP